MACSFDTTGSAIFCLSEVSSLLLPSTWPGFLLPIVGKNLGHFLYFLCFASVQNSETYPPARRTNKQALKNKFVSACCMDVKYNKKLI
jgi:hypothetical protein